MAYQIQNQHLGDAIQTLGNSHYDLLVIDRTRSLRGEEDYDSAADVAYLKSTFGSSVNPKKVVCYIDVGQAESYRWYWQPDWEVGDPEWIVAPDPDGWDENYQVMFWREEWLDIMKEAFRRIIQDGYGGAYLDWLEVYDADGVVEAAEAEGLDPELALIDFVEEILTYCRSLDPDFFFIAQNAAEMGAYPQYLDLFAGISQEAIWFDGGGDPDTGEQPGDEPVDPYWTETYLHDLSYWREAGKVIFHVEYALEADNVQEAFNLGREHGFITYVSMRLLDELSSTPPPHYGVQNLTAGVSAKDQNPAFGPGDDEILFSSSRNGSGNLNLWIMDADGKNPRALTTGENDNVNLPGTSWNGTIDRICFSSDRGGNDDIWLISPDGGNLEQVTDGPGANREPSFSPDGEWIVYQSDREGDREIYKRNPDSGDEIQLTFNNAEDWQPNWSPAGDKIVFQSDRNGNWEIYTMKTDGSAVVRVTNHSAEDTDPSFSPEGTWIVFSSDRVGETELYLVSANGGADPARLTFNDSYEGAASISRDGSILTFESDFSGSLNIWTLGLSLDGTMPAGGEGHVRPFSRPE